MIQATLTRILYAHDLRLGTHAPDSLIFELPGGLEFPVEPTSELLSYLDDYFSRQNDAGDQTEVESDVGPPPVVLNEEVDWMQLPEEVLPLHYKLAIQSLGGGRVKAKLTYRTLEELVNGIDREFTADHWEKVGVPIQPPQPKPMMVTQEVGGGLHVSVDVSGNPYPVEVSDPGERRAGEDDSADDGVDDDDDGSQQF